MHAGVCWPARACAAPGSTLPAYVEGGRGMPPRPLLPGVCPQVADRQYVSRSADAHSCLCPACRPTLRQLREADVHAGPATPPPRPAASAPACDRSACARVSFGEGAWKVHRRKEVKWMTKRSKMAGKEVKWLMACVSDAGSRQVCSLRNVLREKTRCGLWDLRQRLQHGAGSRPWAQAREHASQWLAADRRQPCGRAMCRQSQALHMLAPIQPRLFEWGSAAAPPPPPRARAGAEGHPRQLGPLPPHPPRRPRRRQRRSPWAPRSCSSCSRRRRS
jgi:hypothetical protein